MLRHKYTKKRMKNKYNRKKRTRKRGGVRNPKRKISATQREEAKRLSLRTSPSKDNKMSAKDERDAQAKMSELLGEKCEATKEVNDDGSIDCPTSRSKAKKKFNKFHPDKNPGCKDYASEMMSKYSETCYGDDTNVNRKWDKHDYSYKNLEAEKKGFYDASSSAKSETKQMPDTCKKPASKVMCKRYCNAKGVTDPACECCPGSDAAKQAIAKQNEPLALMDGSVGPSARDLVTPQKQEFPTAVAKQEDPVQPAVAMLEDRPQEIKVTKTQNTDPTPAPVLEVKQQLIQSPQPQPTPVAQTCFESKIDPNYGEVYYVEKYSDGSYTQKSQWEKPSPDQMCKRNTKMTRCKTNNDCQDPTKPYCNPIQEKCSTLPEGWITNQDEAGKAYFYGQYSDGTYSGSQYKVPTEAFNTNNPAATSEPAVTSEPAATSETKSESKFSESDMKFCADKVKRPHRGEPGLIKNKNRKDQTNCMVRNRKDPVICKVAKTDKRNIKKCIPKEINPHLKQKQQSDVKENFPDPIPSTSSCFVSQTDAASNKEYFVEKSEDGSYTGETQWEKPSQDQMCKLNKSKKNKKRNVCIDSNDCKDPKKPYCNPVKQKCVKLPKGWRMALNEEGVPYFFGKKQDGTYSEPSWEVPKEPFKDNTSETKQPSLRQKTWDADKTIGSCREMDLHPGTEYWIDPTTKTMSFDPIDGVKKHVVSKETDYFYNANGETTKDPYDGTCGISKENSSEVKNVEPKKDYIKLFFSTHFNKINEIDLSLTDEAKKVIPWLARR